MTTRQRAAGLLRAVVGAAAALMVMPLAVSRANAGFQQKVALATSVQSLQQSHRAFSARLPKNLQYLEPRAYTVVQGLPMVLQEAYLITLRDYASLSDGDKGQFAHVLRLGNIPNNSRAMALSILNAQFKGVKVTPEIIDHAREHPHDTCWVINKAIDRAIAQVAPRIRNH